MSSIFHSLEAIDHQGKSGLAMDIITAVSELQKNKKVGYQDVLETGMAKAINKHTGLNVRLDVVPGFQAHVLPAFTGSNNVIVNKANTMAILYDHDLYGFIQEQGFFKGTIDLKKSKVTGDFSKLFHHIQIGENFLTRDSKYSAEEVAAIILHEIGHAFVCLEMIARYSRTNYILENGTRDILNAKTKEQRILILDAMENAFGSKIPDKERIAETEKNKNYYRTVFMTLAVRESYNQVGHNMYDLRGFEQLADQFATRHGMGRPLAVALDRLHRQYYDRNYWWSPFHYALMVFEFIMFSMMTWGTFGLWVFILATENYEIYDPTKLRFEKIKLEINNALKDHDLSDEEKQVLISDLKAINSIIDNVGENESFTHFLWNQIIPWGRKERRDIEFNEDIERMFNNSLFAVSAELKA